MFGIRDRQNDPLVELPGRTNSVFVQSACWFLIGNLLGFIIGRFGLRSLILTYNHDWNIAQLLTVLVTLAVGVYVKQVVERRSGIANDRRRYLVDLVNNLKDSLQQLRQIVRAGTSDIAAVTTAICNVNAAEVELRFALQLSGSTCDIAHAEQAIKKYRQGLADFPAQVLDQRTSMMLEKSYVDARKLLGRATLMLHSS